ncbi:MAG: sulfate adenylyltransferase subunit CysN [Planctomycetota bacterium]
MLISGETYDSVEDYLASHNRKDQLRLLTCGSVDDGKSTLIGRLLHDTKLVYEDHLEALRRDSERHGKAGKGEVDYALLCDGLKSEREQGITIDVAYRYFSTARRTFIVADCPGHEQYTRNMATGASTCNLAVILIDARHGVITQTKRHSFIVSLLGIKHVLVAVNKMDLVDYDEAVFNGIRRDYIEFAAKLDLGDIRFVPISALRGDNITASSAAMPWYAGPSVLEQLESVHVASDRNLVDFRFPVQCIVRPDTTFRGYAGSIAAGTVRPGQEVMVLPSRVRTRVERVVTFDGDRDEAFAPQAVTLTLADEVDASRGDVIVHPNNQPHVASEFEAMLVWMHPEPLRRGQQVLVRTVAGSVPATVSALRYRIDVNTLHRDEADALALNEIGRVRISCVRPLVLDGYDRSRATGAFILVDRASCHTLAGGMVREVGVAAGERTPATAAGTSLVSAEQRRALLGQTGGVVWLTGLPMAGKSMVAAELERSLIESGHAAAVLDGSRVRADLSRDLGFSPEDRGEQTRRLAALGAVMADAGLLVIVASASPYRSARDAAREHIGSARFCEVHCSAPLDWCEAHDDRGVYARARAGELQNFTGISAPYEPPDAPDLELPTHKLDPGAAAEAVYRRMAERGWF